MLRSPDLISINERTQPHKTAVKIAGGDKSEPAPKIAVDLDTSFIIKERDGDIPYGLPSDRFVDAKSWEHSSPARPGRRG